MTKQQSTQPDPPAGTRTSKGVVTTVTFPNGVVAKRTSKNGNYTHAVVLSPEDPALVRKVRTERAAELEARLAVLDETLAQEKPVVKLHSRNMHRPGGDPDVGYTGKRDHHGFEAVLIAADGRTVLEYTHCNSKGIVKGIYDYETGDYDADATQPARQSLIAKARSTRERLAKDLEDDRQALADLEAGTYDLGEPRVVRWSSRRDLAEQAARGKYTGYSATRHPYVVPVD